MPKVRSPLSDVLREVSVIASVLDIPSRTSLVLTPLLVAPANGVLELVGEKRPLRPINPLTLDEPGTNTNPFASVYTPLVSEGRDTGPAELA